MPLLEKIQGALLGCAIGDALGRPFESSLFSDRRLAPLVEARAKQQSLWAYSDDTQMMLSVAESMLEKKAVEPAHLIQTLAKNYDPSRGYGKGMKLVIRALERGLSWQEAASSSWAEGSKGNGAAVRVAPIACLYLRDKEALQRAARSSALVSHTHPIAQTAAVLQATALSYLLQASADGWSPQNFLQNLEQEAYDDAIFANKIAQVSQLYYQSAGKEEAVELLGNGSSADESLALAWFIFLRWAPSVEAVIANTIQCGGDTDSIAALSGALVGALVGVKQVPEQWMQNLENGRKGRDYLLALAGHLAALESL